MDWGVGKQAAAEMTYLIKAKPTCGNVSEETPNPDLEEYMHLYDHRSVNCNSQDSEEAQAPISR